MNFHNRLKEYKKCIYSYPGNIAVHLLLIPLAGLESEIAIPSLKVSEGVSFISPHSVAVPAGAFSAIYSELLPALVVNSKFTPSAGVITLLGGVLVILAGLDFAIHYFKKRNWRICYL